MPNKDRSGILARRGRRAIPDLGVFVRQWHSATRRAEEKKKEEKRRSEAVGGWSVGGVVCRCRWLVGGAARFVVVAAGWSVGVTRGGYRRRLKNKDQAFRLTEKTLLPSRVRFPFSLVVFTSLATCRFTRAPRSLVHCLRSYVVPFLPLLYYSLKKL